MKFTARSVLAATAILAAGLVFVACGGGEPEIEVTTNSQGYKQIETIDMNFQWKISGSSIEMIVFAPADGWVGVGFDPQEFMKGANFVLGYVADGAAAIEDHYGNQLINHAKDTELGGTDDVTLISGVENSSGTTLRFSIPLDSGDEYDKPLTAGSTHKVVLAYGLADDFTTAHSETTRTTVELEL